MFGFIKKVFFAELAFLSTLRSTNLLSATPLSTTIKMYFNEQPRM